jgi:polyisoprenoid-binding protein YceI
MKKLVVGLFALVVVAVGGWLVYDNVLASDAADEFTLEDEAAEAAADAEPDAGAAGSDGGDLSGSWQVVAPSEAGYRIVEDGVVGEKVVTGRTTSVTGTVELSATSLESTDITVDMASVSSDEPLRDTAFRESLLDTAQHPTAQFVQGEPVELEVPAAGTSLAVEVPGTLVLKGVEQPVVASIEGIETDGTITIVGTIEVQLADFGIEPPSIPNLLTARDTALVEFKLVLERG